MLGKSKSIDKEHCKYLLEKIMQHEEKFNGKFGNRKTLHIPNSLDGWFWQDVPEEIKQNLEKSVYPFDKKITGTWFSIIDGTEDHPGFHGLHQDLYYTPESEEANAVKDTYVTSLVVYKSDDFKGGQFIIGGDGWTDNLTGAEADRTRASRKENLSHRLKVIENQNIGDTTVWTDFTIHGVAEVTSGRRISLMMTKDAPDEK